MNLLDQLTDSGLLRRLLARRSPPRPGPSAPAAKALPWQAVETGPVPRPGREQAQRHLLRCIDCGAAVAPWHTDSSLWQEVMGRSRVTGAPGHGICPTCFIARAAAVGVHPAAWALSAQWRVGRQEDARAYRPRHAQDKDVDQTPSGPPTHTPASD